MSTQNSPANATPPPVVYDSPTLKLTASVFALATLLLIWRASAPVGAGVSVLAMTLVLALLALAAGCVTSLAIQFTQWRFNKVSMAPGLALALGGAVLLAAMAPAQPVLPYGAAVAWAVLLGIWPLAAIVVVVGLIQSLRGLPLGLRGLGFIQLYRFTPEDRALFQREAEPFLASPRPEPEPAAQAAPAPASEPPLQPAQEPLASTYTYQAQAPRQSFDRLFGNEALKLRLREAVDGWRNEGKNGVVLFGPPGTGKTAFAEATAACAGLRIITVTFGDLASKWINQTTERLKQVFDEAAAQAPVVLFFDEAETVLAKRDNDSSYEEYQRTTSEFLTQSCNARERNIFLMAATNFPDRLDRAAMREGRFDFQIEVPLPDARARKGLIVSKLAESGCVMEDKVLDRLVRRWGGFSVPRILLVTGDACVLARQEARSGAPGQVAVAYDHCYRALRAVQGRRGGAPEGAKALAEMYLEPQTAEALRDIAARLTRVDEVEANGGSLPTGLLFYGPPGTGKTATAMALAHECGWTFIPRMGRDLLAEGAMGKLRGEASDLRPAIVFIDEADDILGDRQTTGVKAATNELLGLIDGAGGMLHDVVWIAATNHPDSMDKAATRGGRFGKKIGFGLLGESMARRLIADWAKKKLADDALVIAGTPEAFAAAAWPALRELSPADMYEVLKEANNNAITRNLRTGSGRVLTVAILTDAVRMLRG